MSAATREKTVILQDLFHRPNPSRAMRPPRYIGLRTHRYGPLDTSTSGASNGAGVPLPAKVNQIMHETARMPPRTINAAPSKVADDGKISQSSNPLRTSRASHAQRKTKQVAYTSDLSPVMTARILQRAHSLKRQRPHEPRHETSRPGGRFRYCHSYGPVSDRISGQLPSFTKE
jgi:hypothetical protein